MPTDASSPQRRTRTGRRPARNGRAAAAAATEVELGAVVEAARGQTTFTVFAPDATRVVLELYAHDIGQPATAQHELVAGGEGRWSVTVAGAGHGTRYGFRCWGPNWLADPAWQPGSPAGFISDIDARGNRFNPNKLLLDPYAREVTHTQFDQVISDAGQSVDIFANGDAPYRGRPSREGDSGPWAPKGIVVVDDTSPGLRPGLPPENTVIYEVHLAHLSAHPSASALRASLSSLTGFAGVVDVPEAERGTYAGAARMAPYLAALGFTTVEFLPVQQSCSGANEINAWGYKTLGFFAPHRAYALDQSPGGPTREFKQMVHAFHDAGLEVYLDVVYNHTGEGGNEPGDATRTRFVSQGGFACANYYVLDRDFALEFGATGVQNQVNYDSQYAQQLVLDSLAYWVDVMGVDGFRFDLAPVLGQTANGLVGPDGRPERPFSSSHPLLLAIEAFGRDRGVEVIAEPWDAGVSYQVGRFPSGWAEWNDRFRDGLRRFLRGQGNVLELAAALNGSYEFYADQGGPHRSIDFITAHDGFTLMDLVSYDHKINDQPWPFGPSDGGNDHNLSWDSNGDHALRRQRIRNAWVLLTVSRGVPMVVAGDEFGRTQNGNNNPYNVDSLAMANNYAMATSNTPTALPVDPAQPDGPRYHDNFGAAPVAGVNPVFQLATYLVRLRRDHPGLRQRSYGDLGSGGGDVSYLFTRPDADDSTGDGALAAGGGPLVEGDRALALRIDCSGVGDDLLVLVNMDPWPRWFAVPQPGRMSSGNRWRRIVDTSSWFEREGNCWLTEAGEVIVGSYVVSAWSIVVLRCTG